MTTPDKSAALRDARERLEAAYAERIHTPSGKTDCATCRGADLRLVLDALKEAERPRHEIAFAYSMKHGWPICGKCGIVMHDDSPYCAERIPSINTRDGVRRDDNEEDLGNPEDWE